MRADRSRIWVATTVLVAIAIVLFLGVMLSACGDKFEGTWMQKDGTSGLEIEKASGNTYTITATGSTIIFPMSNTVQGTKQGDTIHIPVGHSLPGPAYPAETTLRLVSGDLEMKYWDGTTMFVKQ